MVNFKKKAQGSSGMKLIVGAAILIAILFVAWYFISRGSGSVSTATGCGEYDCYMTNAACVAAHPGWVSSTPCVMPREPKNADSGKSGRCCQPNPLS